MEARRRTTLSDQMAVSNSSNLGDLLKVREGSERRESLTLGSILGCSSVEKQDIAVAYEAANRTLHDVIRDEEGSTNPYASVICGRTATATAAAAAGSSRNKISWKPFRDLLLLRRSAAGWIPSPSTISIPANLNINPITSRSTTAISSPDNAHSVRSWTRSPESVRTDLAAVLSAERRHEEEAEVRVSSARVSLMALLEQTDVYTAAVDGDGEREDVIVTDMEEKGIGVENLCCVCMVRKKGAAFIPCGHTFCRVCSRELWVGRGSCPLCNAPVQEILDIF